MSALEAAILRRYVVVDLDGTLTVDLKSVPYPEKPLNHAVAEATAAARAQGFGVMVLTARGMRTWKNDRALVEEHVRPGVEAWLARHGVQPDQVQVGKPWCGPRGFYVDDRNLHPEEYVFRFSGPWAGETVAAVVRGQAEDPRAAHERLTRVERWLEVGSWTWADQEVTLDEPLLDQPCAARWTLVLRADADPAGWFAWKHRTLDGSPLAEPEAGFVLAPTELVQTVGTELGALKAAVRELG